MIEIRCKMEEAGRTIAAWVAIDSLVGGSSSGGVRIREDVTPEELRILASLMTLKYGFLGIPQGGAKGGLSFDPAVSLEIRRRILLRFGLEIAPLLRNRTFIPGPDMGTGPEDIRIILEGAARTPPRIRISAEGSGRHTGSSVFAGAATALEERGLRIRESRVAVEGFGKVGVATALLFHRHGARVIAVSTKEGALFREKGLPVPELVETAGRRGPSFVLNFPEAERIGTEDLLALETDVLCPCALSHSIHAGNSARVRAGIISSGANAPLTPEALAALESLGSLVLPDFITNSGGVLGVFLEIAGFGTADVDVLIPKLLVPRIRELIRVGSIRGGSLHVTAARAALDRFARFKEEAEGTSARSRFLRHSSVRRIRRMMPRGVARTLGLAYFQKRLGRPMFEEH